MIIFIRQRHLVAVHGLGERSSAIGLSLGIRLKAASETVMLAAYNRLKTYVLLCVSVSPAASAWSAGSNPIEFNRDVRPIITENCFACHGPDKNQRKAKLRLDVREIAIEREAFVPGKPDQSKLVERIFTTDTDDVMPPPKSRKQLTAAQKETLKQWSAA